MRPLPYARARSVPRLACGCSQSAHARPRSVRLRTAALMRPPARFHGQWLAYDPSRCNPSNARTRIVRPSAAAYVRPPARASANRHAPFIRARRNSELLLPNRGAPCARACAPFREPHNRLSSAHDRLLSWHLVVALWNSNANPLAMPPVHLHHSRPLLALLSQQGAVPEALRNVTPLPTTSSHRGSNAHAAGG